MRRIERRTAHALLEFDFASPMITITKFIRVRKHRPEVAALRQRPVAHRACYRVFHDA